eukprot:12928512-Prorocentrum_lima.AAC.1
MEIAHTPGPSSLVAIEMALVGYEGWLVHVRAALPMVVAEVLKPFHSTLFLSEPEVMPWPASQSPG